MNPITQKQLAYLSRLINRVGKQKYIDIKNELGLYGLTLMRLTSGQASKLIDALKQEAGR